MIYNSRLILIFLLLFVTYESCSNSHRVVDDNVDVVIPILEDSYGDYFISNLDEYEFQGNNFVGQDSTIISIDSLNGITILKSIALSKSGLISNIQSGSYEIINVDGITIQKGEFKVGRYVQCCAGGLCAQFHDYRYGNWEYFYDDGSTKALVQFNPRLSFVRTSCEGGDYMYFGKVDVDNSRFYDEDGNLIELSSKDIIYNYEQTTSQVKYGYIYNTNSIRDTIVTNRVEVE